MNISEDIINEAKRIVKDINNPLPASIKVGGAEPVFYVGNIDDDSIVAHTTIGHDNKIYKIGIKKK